MSQLGAVAVNVLASTDAQWPGWLDVIRRFPFLSALVLTCAIAVLTVSVSSLPELRGAPSATPGAPPVPDVPGWVVGRPAEVDQIIRGLRRRGGRAVGITTALHGAGGFGKTTLAMVACADRRIRRHFRDRVYVVTIGRDVRGRAAIAAKVGEVTRFITGDAMSFDDPALAGAHLGRLLDQRPRLLVVIDDVWEVEQLEPFLVGGQRCARLVTTRIPAVLPAGAVPVPVDQMLPEQARAVLTWELPELPLKVTAQLLKVTGRWPLLMRLANRALAADVATGRDVSEAADDLLKRLRARGPVAVDELTVAGQSLNLDDPRHRAQAVRSTIEASTSLLPDEGTARLAELGVFAEDEPIPVGLVQRLWKATAGLEDAEARVLCRRLASLALVSLSDDDGGAISIHDVVRAYLREELGAARLVAVNAALIDGLASDLPMAEPLDEAAPELVVAWWCLGDRNRYVWDYLIAHLIAANRSDAAEAVATDIRWSVARLRRFGAVAPIVDLTAVPSRRAQSLKVELTRTTHLLTPTDPEHLVVGVLLSRLQGTPGWGPQVAAMQARCADHLLVNRWPLPDMPHPALRNELPGHTGAVNAVAISPLDGSWLATGGDDQTVRLWETATGRLRLTLTGHTHWVRDVAIAPDGSWLATASDDQTVRLWDAGTGDVRAVLTGRRFGAVNAVAISPDGSWLASAGDDRIVRVWDVTGQPRFKLTGHTSWVSAVVISPDGSWLASASDDGTVRVWDAATGQCHDVVSHEGPVNAVAFGPDGEWFASASDDRTVRIWGMTDCALQATLTGHTGHGQVSWMTALAIAPDGSWLAVLNGRTVQIWENGNRTRRVLTAHTDGARSVAIAPDGSWFATVGNDRRARIWEPFSGSHDVPPQSSVEIVALAIGPDGSWLAAAGGKNELVQVWDVDTGLQRHVLSGNTRTVSSVAVAPDGSWLATGHDYGKVKVWDIATGKPRKVLTQHYGRINAVAISPDGTWIASASDDQRIILWEATGSIRDIFERHTRRVHDVAIAPDGSWLVSAGGDSTVAQWDVETGRLRRILRGPVTAVAISPNGLWLATGGYDCSVIMRDADTGQVLATLTGHAGQVTAVAISPDGSWLATVSNDRTVRVWDVAAERCVALARLESRANDCAWLPDSSTLAVGGARGLYLFEHRCP